jgi:hypothetical protein
MDQPKDLRELGNLLVEDSKTETVSARGIINELFPYVYEASSRMSSRAISRWLEGNGVKLSAATIAKALRNQAPYWEELFEELEPAARIFANAHDVSIKDLMLKDDLFSALCNQPPALAVSSENHASQEFGEYQSAREKLQSDWFSMSLRSREACLAHVDFTEEDDASTEKAAKQ